MSRLHDKKELLISIGERFADLILLNILFIVTCIPIVTVGAAITALNSVTLKMVIDKEDGHIIRAFLRSFLQNLLQASLAWLIFGVLYAVLILDLYIFHRLPVATPVIVWIFIIVLMILVSMNMNCTLALQARFHNSLRQTLKNSMIISLMNLGKLIKITLISFAPIFFLITVSASLPAILLLGFSGPAYLNSFTWRKVFAKYTPHENTPPCTGYVEEGD